MSKNTITINARKFDGKIHRSWEAELIKNDNSLMIFVGEFKNEVRHPDLGVIRRGTISYEYYWLDKWFSIFRFHEPNGELRNYYCNINMPPIFNEKTLDYIDLDIDILVWKDFNYEILDRDEYVDNSKIFNYSDNLKKTVETNVNKLKEMIELRRFPFSITKANNEIQ